MTIKRIYPEGKSALINWIEENFHEIDSYVVTFTMNDGTTMTIHHCNSFVEAMGITSVSQFAINEIGADGDFQTKKKD